MTLKENYATLYEDMSLFLQDAKAHTRGQVAYQCEETVDADHGRLEILTYWITSDIEWLGAKVSWPNLQSVGMVESCRVDPYLEVQRDGGAYDGFVCQILGQWKPG